MFKALFNYVKVVRQRRATLKTASVDSGRFDFAKMLDDAQNERNRLWENPPPCGAVICFVQKYANEDAHGEFIFKTTDVEQELKDILRANPHLANGDEGAILHWVQGCNESVTEPTNASSIWTRFQYVADSLVRAGKAEIHCMACKAAIRSDQISTNDDSGKRGWNFGRVICPHGHNLLVVESVHLMTR
jgi:hypothetical protein